MTSTSTFEPSLIPTQVPTIINSTTCPLRIATSRCPALIESTQLEPVEDCDCYQFCGNDYVGCCNQNEVCSIECDTDLVPVAGCRLDGTNGPPEPACRVTLANGTLLELEEGDSFGDLVTTQCGSASEFPCFCRATSEDDLVRCPYCPFVTNDGSLLCARDGENITFVGSGDVLQTCTCNYLGNNQVATLCDPVELPVEECSLIQNSDQCAVVTEFVNPIEDCDCYNFCQGEYTSCCKYGETCEVSCLNAGSIDDLVAGCEIDRNKQPVIPPIAAPSEEPSIKPPMCLVENNTAVCTELIRDQEPVEDCDCYNYCGSEFAGCCPYDTDCSITCTGVAPGTVITAGCQLVVEEPPAQTPTESPTSPVTGTPTENPTESPTENPTVNPTQNPTQNPIKNPTQNPTQNPTEASPSYSDLERFRGILVSLVVVVFYSLL